MKNYNYYKKLDYTLRLKENSDSGYFAEIEELPGCITEGDTKEETLAMIEDAKEAWLKTALKKKLKIPEPTKDEFSGKLNIRLPKSLHRSLTYRAKQEGVSLNTLISNNLATTVK